MDYKEIGKEILDPNIDLGTDYAEVVLDEFFDDGLLKEIPIVRTLAAFIRTGAAIKERFFIKKFLVFLRELHRGVENKDELKAIRERFDHDKNYRDKVTEQVMLVIERLDSITKAKIAAHLFRAYLNKAFDWDRFIALNNCLNNLQEIVFPVLHILSKHNFPNMNHGPAFEELKATLNEDSKGQFNSRIREYQALLMAAGIANINGTYFGVTSLGQDLYREGISKIFFNEYGKEK